MDYFPSLVVNPKIDFFHDFGPPFGLGCRATESIETGELLLSVSYDDCIWPATPEADESGLFLAIEYALNDPNSKWFSYVNRVRSSGCLNIVPCMWPQSCIHSITGTSLGYVINACGSENTYARISTTALAYMLSRSFVSESERGSIASVPFGDMFNHSTFEWNTRIREIVDEKRFVFYAERDIEENAQIFNNYGQQSGLEMMATHGFIDKGMNVSEIFFPLSLMTEETKSSLGPEEPLVRLDVGGPDVLPADLRSALPLAEFIPSLVSGLKRAVNRMLEKASRIDLRAIQREDVRFLVSNDVENLNMYSKKLENFHHYHFFSRILHIYFSEL